MSGMDLVHLCTLCGVRSVVMFYFVFFRKFRLPIGLHSSCNISPTANGTFQICFTKCLVHITECHTVYIVNIHTRVKDKSHTNKTMYQIIIVSMKSGCQCLKLNQQAGIKEERWRNPFQFRPPKAIEWKKKEGKGQCWHKSTAGQMLTMGPSLGPQTVAKGSDSPTWPKSGKIRLVLCNFTFRLHTRKYGWMFQVCQGTVGPIWDSRHAR